MKTRSILLILAILLFSSCIVKSLQPFYISESLSFNEKLVGNWTDNKNGKWTVESIKDKFEQDKEEGVELSKEDLRVFESYKEGYYIKYIKADKEAGFIAMPFTIDEQYFIDFIPIEIEDDDINSLAAQHLLKTHSVAKLDINSDTNVVFSWLSEKRITDFFNEHKFRLKHEKIGLNEDLLLTASSKELYNFLKKYLRSNVTDKWKKEDMFTLTKTDSTP
jgi:hypothetical protein